MSIPKYVSAEEYSRQSGMGVEEIKRLCRIGEIKCLRTEGGYYKIPVYNDDVVSKELYEEEKQKRIEAEKNIWYIYWVRRVKLKIIQTNYW